MAWLCCFLLVWQADNGFFVPVEPAVRPLLLADDPAALPSWEVGLEFLYWYPRRGYLPPVVTTGPADSAGVPGAPGVATLYGGERIDLRHDRLIGVRGLVGTRLDAAGLWHAELRFFILERDSSNFTLKPQSDVLLARPYVHAATGTPAAEVFAGSTPDGRRLEGSLNAYTRIEVFGQEVNLRRELAAREWLSLEGLVGARFLQMRDRFDVTATSRELPERSTLYGVSDHFQTFNKFYGGQVGLRSTLYWQPWTLQLDGALALGATDENIRAKATRLTQTPNLRDERPLGLFVLPSNAGSFRRTVFDLVAEFNLSLSYQLTDHLRLFVGYTFLGWANPVRSGNQTDALNTDEILGVTSAPARPAITFRDELFWLQGASVGGELRW